MSTKPAKVTSRWQCLRTLTSWLCLVAPPCAACVLVTMTTTTWITGLVLAAAPTVLGLLWTPDYQHFLVGSPSKRTRRHYVFQMFLHVTKISAIFFFCCLDLHFWDKSSDTKSFIFDLESGFHMFYSSQAFTPFLIHNIFCLIGYGLTYLSISLLFPMYGIVIPSLLSPIMTTLSFFFILPTINDINPIVNISPSYVSIVSTSILALLLILPCFFTSSDFLKTQLSLLTPFRRSFFSLGWNAIFYDQKVLLDYYGEAPADLSTAYNKRTDRVYICTTMYREADYEMERLLKSLIKLPSDPLLSTVHLESHVFIDNGCKQTQLTEFSLQLLYVLSEKVHVDLSTAKYYKVPYGIQIIVDLSSNLTMFIHFKDPSKVKAKKRWSQVMYINYVMQFRTSIWKPQHKSELVVDMASLKSSIKTLCDDMSSGVSSYNFAADFDEGSQFDSGLSSSSSVSGGLCSAKVILSFINHIFIFFYNEKSWLLSPYFIFRYRGNPFLLS